MQKQPQMTDVVRAAAVAVYSAVAESVEVVREKVSGDTSAVAVVFADRTGGRRRGVLGFRRSASDRWRPDGGFTGSVRAASDQDVWATWGGWGGDADTPHVLGGWVADPAAVTARATDPTGATLDEVIENGVALFMYPDTFGASDATLSLLDTQGRVLRSGPLTRRP